MKKEYVFYVENDGTLVCSGTENKKRFYKRGTNACKILKKLDKHGEMSININKDNITLYNHYWNITIKDISSFKSHGYLNDLKKNSNQIEQKILEAKQTNKNKKKVISSFTVPGVVLTASTIIALLSLNPKKETVLNAHAALQVTQKSDEIKRESEELAKARLRQEALEKEQEELRKEQERILEEKRAQQEAIAAYNEQKEIILEQTVYIDTNQTWDDQRRYDCEDNYGEVIEEISQRFGISPNIIKAIASQEGAGTHKNVMQVSSGWYHSKIEYYDFTLNRWHKITCTREETHDTDDTLYISLNDPNISIYFGEAVLIRSLNRNKGNMWAAMDEYNIGSADAHVRKVASSDGITTDEYLTDYYNPDIQYHQGNHYIQECLKFLDNDPITYTYVNKETNEFEYVTIYPIFKNTTEEEVIQNNLGDDPSLSENSISENKVLQLTQ